MKILICSPISGVVGGIAKWTLHIKNYYSDVYNGKDVNLEFYDFSRITTGKNISNLAIKCFYALKEYSSLVMQAIKTINCFDGDIVHITTPASFLLVKDYLLLKCVKKKKIKSIIHFHFGRIPILFEQKNWEYKLLIRVLKLADKIVVIDNSSYNTLIAAGYTNVDFLPNPISSQVFEMINQHPEIKKVDNKILFAGHHLVTKGVFELINACKDIPNIQLKMIGFISSEMKAQLLQSAGPSNSQWLEIAGEMSYDKTIQEMLSARLFVLPTYTEGFPNVILESMACGCSIVTTDVGAIPEMLNIKDGFKCGICVKPKDVEGLRDAIVKMIENQEYAKSCGDNARQRVVEEYSMENVWCMILNIWTSTLAY